MKTKSILKIWLLSVNFEKFTYINLWTLRYIDFIPNSITFPIHPISAFEKSRVSNAVISVLIATLKNNEVPVTYEKVLNSLLGVHGSPSLNR